MKASGSWITRVSMTTSGQPLAMTASVPSISASDAAGWTQTKS